MANRIFGVTMRARGTAHEHRSRGLRKVGNLSRAVRLREASEHRVDRSARPYCDVFDLPAAPFAVRALGTEALAVVGGDLVLAFSQAREGPRYRMPTCISAARRRRDPDIVATGNGLEENQFDRATTPCPLHPSCQRKSRCHGRRSLAAWNCTHGIVWTHDVRFVHINVAGEQTWPARN